MEGGKRARWKREEKIRLGFGFELVLPCQELRGSLLGHRTGPLSLGDASSAPFLAVRAGKKVARARNREPGAESCCGRGDAASGQRAPLPRCGWGLSLAPSFPAHLGGPLLTCPPPQLLFHALLAQSWVKRRNKRERGGWEAVVSRQELGKLLCRKYLYVLGGCCGVVSCFTEHVLV